MRTWRGILWGYFASLLTLMPASARAQLFVAAPAASQAIEHAELAYALGDDAAVTWLSLRANRGPLAIVAALPSGVRARAGLVAWLSSLEAIASVNVLPPSSAERCLEGARYARVIWPRAAAAAPTELLVDSADDVSTALAELGLAAPSPLPTAASYLIWQFPEPVGSRTTRPLRIEGAALALVANGRFPVLVSALTPGSRAYPREVAASELEVSFTAGARAQSDYIEQLRAWLERDEAPLLEMRARGPLFDWTIYEEALSTAPLVRHYAERAAIELGAGDAEACAKQLSAFRGQATADTSACDDALDATLAFTAAGPESATLQRFAMASASGVDPAHFFAGGYVAPPLLRAVSISGGSCPETPLPPLVREPVGSTPGAGADRPVVESVADVDDYDAHEDVDVEVSCWGDTSRSYADHPDDADCSSDTSSASESDDADCSSDTASASEPADATCSSDTSGTSDSDDADCSSDSSSTGRDDAGCGSDSSSHDDASDSGCSSDTSSGEDSGYDGETCTGSAAPRAERSGQQHASLETRGQRQPRKRRQGPKMSLWTVGFAALVLPFRRRKRGAARAG